MLINSSRAPGELGLANDGSVVTIPASQLAKEHLGRPVPNTALLSAFLSLTGLFPGEALTKVLGAKFKGVVLENNIRLIEAAADTVPVGAWQKEEQHAASA